MSTNTRPTATLETAVVTPTKSQSLGPTSPSTTAPFVMQDSDVLNMVGIDKGWKNKYQKSLEGYLCDKCKEVDLGSSENKPDPNSFLLYWLKGRGENNEHFRAAICTACYAKSRCNPRARRRRGLNPRYNS